MLFFEEKFSLKIISQNFPIFYGYKDFYKINL